MRQTVVAPTAHVPQSGVRSRFDFGAGWPSPETFPADELAASFQRVLKQHGAAALQYGDVAGFEPLRAVIAERIGRKDRRELASSQVSVTAGSSNALALICQAMVKSNDVVLVEALTWPIMLTTLRSTGCTVLPVPIDDEGVDVAAAAAMVRHLQGEGRSPRLLYTIPNFQNPTATVLSKARRRALVELAASSGMVVIEDDIYGDIRYEGEAEPSLFSLDSAGCVIKTGGLSKSVAPGLRLGWVVGTAAQAKAVDAVRSDLGISPIVAMAVADYLQRTDLDEHITAITRVYKRKREAVLEALSRYCAKGATWQSPQGGFYVWLKLRPGVDGDRLALAASAEGVEYRRGSYYHVSGFDEPGLRLGFSRIELGLIEPGIAALGRALERSTVL